MVKNIKKQIRNQRGLTLIELLAVVVILGIIAAIAIPSIGGIIENTKKDAHIANAQQIANAARLYVTTEKKTIDTTGITIGLNELIAKGHIESIKDPSGASNANYAEGTVNGTTYTANKTRVHVVKINNKIQYQVTLVAANNSGTTYINGIDASNLVRENVYLNGVPAEPAKEEGVE
ncbi:Tfp pilus assembly protein FimT/FimU [Fredinandcohnia humi]